MSDSKWSEFNSTHLGSDDTTAVQRSTCVVPAVPSHAALAPASRDPGGAMKPNRGLALSDSDTKIPCCRFLNADGFIKFVGTDPKGAFKCDMDSPANKKIYIDQVTFATKAHGRTARLVDLCQNHAIGSCPESESDCAGTHWRRRSLRCAGDWRRRRRGLNHVQHNGHHRRVCACIRHGSAPSCTPWTERQ